MPGGIVRAEAQRLMASSFNGTTYQLNTQSHLALLVVAGSATATGTEMSGGPGPYARQPAAFNTNETPGSALNSAALNFAGLPAGTVVQVATFDAPTAGNRRWWADLGNPRVIAEGDAISFSQGSVVFQLQ